MRRLALAIVIALLLVPAPSFAHGWGWGGGAVAAGVLGGFATGIILDRAFAPWPGYYPYPYYPYPYYQPAPMVVQQSAPVYQQSQPQYWYWCDDPKGYYPYVQECPSNWKQVVPQTTPPR